MQMSVCHRSHNHLPHCLLRKGQIPGWCKGHFLPSLCLPLCPILSANNNILSSLKDSCLSIYLCFSQIWFPQPRMTLENSWSRFNETHMPYSLNQRAVDYSPWAKSNSPPVSIWLRNWKWFLHFSNVAIKQKKEEYFVISENCIEFNGHECSFTGMQPCSFLSILPIAAW